MEPHALRRLIRALVRAPLRAIPRAARIPILTGPARGMRWVVGSATHGCWIGSYERETQDILAGLVRPGMVVYDIGAHAGFYTLLFSRLVGPSGTVVSFEPLPENIDFLKLHIAVNRRTNVHVVEAAVSDASGTARFAAGRSTTMGRIAQEGTLSVQLVQLDEMVSAGLVAPPSCMKIDVEGAELAVLRGARVLLETARPTLLLATHGWDIRTACIELLERLDYSVTPLALDKNELMAVSKARG